MLISSTMPSKPDSVLKGFLKLTWAEAELIAMFGVMTSLVLVVVGFVVKMSFGALDGLVVEETNATPPPVTAVVQPAGKFGVVTLSKFSLKPTIGCPTPST